MESGASSILRGRMFETSHFFILISIITGSDKGDNLRVR